MEKFNVGESILEELGKISIDGKKLDDIIIFKKKEKGKQIHLQGYVKERQVLSILVTPGEDVELYICTDRPLKHATYNIKNNLSDLEKECVVDLFIINFIPELFYAKLHIDKGIGLGPIDWSNS